MKIDFHACVFRFGPMGIFINLTIRSVFSSSLLRVLIHLQLEFGNHCEEMVENIRLDALVFFPYFIAGEKIDLDRYAIFSRLQLADDQIKVRINNRETCQVFLHIDTEHLRIGRCHAFVRLVVASKGISLRNVSSISGVQNLMVLRSRKMDSSRDGTRFDHSPPVLERSVYQRIRRMVEMVLSKFWILTVFSVISCTMPFASPEGSVTQSPGRTISLAESCMPATNPKIVSLNTNIRIAAEAPNPANRLQVTSRSGCYNDDPADKEQQDLKHLHEPFDRTVLVHLPHIIHIQEH